MACSPFNPGDEKRFQSSSSPKAGCYGRSNVRFIRVRRFQSSSSPKAGCYYVHLAKIRGQPCFNPHPARRLDAMQRVFRDTDGRRRFQSSSSPKAGCYVAQRRLLLLALLFQSSSSPKAGCYSLWCAVLQPLESFNPHPARRLDAICVSRIRDRRHIKFQSSSSPKAGCYDIQL